MKKHTQGLGSKCMATGNGPSLLTEEWTKKMVSNTSTIELMCTRIIADYEGVPPGMRKATGTQKDRETQRQREEVTVREEGHITYSTYDV